jgi:site-specific DNA-methyltransferase (adenine-specific)
MSRFSKVLWSSASDEWATPQVVFDRLDKEFHFDLDPCATDENHKCSAFFKKEQDGLQYSWAGHSVFVNPPFSDIKAWVEKSYLSSLKPNTRVVMLVPARTDTKWFHKYVTRAREVRFIEGRLKFGGSDNSAPFPSMIVVFEKAGGAAP